MSDTSGPYESAMLSLELSLKKINEKMTPAQKESFKAMDVACDLLTKNEEAIDKWWNSKKYIIGISPTVQTNDGKTVPALHLTLLQPKLDELGLTVLSVQDQLLLECKAFGFLALKIDTSLHMATLF